MEKGLVRATLQVRSFKWRMDLIQTSLERERRPAAGHQNSGPGFGGSGPWLLTRGKGSARVGFCSQIRYYRHGSPFVPPKERIEKALTAWSNGTRPKGLELRLRASVAVAHMCRLARR